MNGPKLKEKEELFCLFYQVTGNGREAALLAGYSAEDAEKEALLLLKNRRIIRRLERLGKTGGCRREEIAAGFRRLAFGSVNDAVCLALMGKELSTDELLRLDLYNLSELKTGEKGIEMKFYDRQKALAMLMELESEGNSESHSSFYKALEQGAAVLRREGETGE